MSIVWHEGLDNPNLVKQSQNREPLRHINQLIKDVMRYPFEGTGKPEPLKENLSGFWSH